MTERRDYSQTLNSRSFFIQASLEFDQSVSKEKIVSSLNLKGRVPKILKRFLSVEDITYQVSSDAEQEENSIKSIFRENCSQLKIDRQEEIIGNLEIGENLDPLIALYRLSQNPKLESLFVWVGGKQRDINLTWIYDRHVRLNFVKKAIKAIELKFDNEMKLSEILIEAQLVGKIIFR